MIAGTPIGFTVLEVGIVPTCSRSRRRLDDAEDRVKSVKTRMIRSWLVGACILIAVFAAWSLFLHLQIFSDTLLALLWVSPGVAAFVTSILSPARKVLLGSSMAIVAAMLVVVLSWIFQMRDIGVDFPGIRGGSILFTLVVVGAAVPSLLGGIAGMLATRARHQ